MSKFGMKLTNAGIAKVINATMSGQKLDIVQFAVGDANGTAYEPTQDMTALKNLKWRGPVASVEIEKDNPFWIVVTCPIPAEHGGFWIREAGLYDAAGDLVAIGKTPDSYKPILAEGASKDFVIEPIIEVSNAAVVTLKIDPNVIQASREYVDKKIEKEFSELNKETSNILDITKRKEPLQAVAGFVFDDSPLQDYTLLLPVTKPYGVPISIAVITGGYATNLFHPNHFDKLRELQDIHKWDLLAHTNTHQYLATLPRDEQEYEMTQCIKNLIDFGFKRPRGIVYPYGSFNSDTIELARKHFEFGVAAGTNLLNGTPIDTYKINRIQFDFTNPNNNIEWYKSKIDEAKKRNEAIIFMGHTNVQTDGRFWFEEDQQQLMRDVIEYIQSINMPIKTVSDIYDMFKNVYDAPNIENSIGADGKPYGYNATRFTRHESITAVTPISEFNDGITRKTFLIADGQTFIESNGGTLITYKHALADLSWQEWHPANSNNVYKRVPSGQTWGAWMKFKALDTNGFTDVSWLGSGIGATTLIGAFPNGTSKRTFLVADGQTFIESNSGTLITHKHSIAELCWQEWHPSNSNNVYKRVPTTNGQGWQAWRALAEVVYLTDKSTNAKLASEFAAGKTVELLTNAYNATQDFPTKNGGAMLVTVTTAAPNIISKQTFIDYQGYEFTRIAISNVWSAWRGNT